MVHSLSQVAGLLPVGPIVQNLVVALLLAGLGAAAKSAWDLIDRKWRMRHIRNVFGDLRGTPGEMSVVVPVFEPAHRDNFHAEGSSQLTKRVLIDGKPNQLETRSVPLFSDVLVLDDFRAYRQLERLFAEYRYGLVEFDDDISALKIWDRRLIVCFGGPRSNQKLRQVLNGRGAPFLTIEEEGSSLTTWRLGYAIGDLRGDHCADEENSYGLILKIRNPNRDDGWIMAIAGDSAESTQMASAYLRTHLTQISRTFGASPFLIVLHAVRNSPETIQVEAQVEL